MNAIFIESFSNRFLWMVFIAFCLSSCMVGPNFRSPPPPRTKSYTEIPLPKKTVSIPSEGKVGKAQYFIRKKDIPAEWWHLYHSKKLNALVRMGIINNPNLQAAYAALRVSQEAFNQGVGNLLFPAFNAAFTAERQRIPSATTIGTVQPSIFNIYNSTVNVSYILDIWGGSRRQVEALAAQVDYQQFQLIGAYLTLTNNIVTTAITIASLEAQLEATRSLLQFQQSQLKVIQAQYKLGGVSEGDVYTQKVLVDQTVADIPPLEQKISILTHSLSVLVGMYPNEKLPKLKLEELTLPVKIPVSLPAQLVRQRPDVRGAEALLHAASAQIGVADANLLPQLALSGYIGYQGFVLPQLIRPSNYTWDMLGAVTQPLFHGGALLAARRQAIAAFDQACAQYHETVLQAMQNVADALRALEIDARLLEAQRHAEESAYKNLKISEYQYRLGGASILILLNGQRQYQTTRIARIQAEATRYNDTAALFQALGGGWWHKEWCVKECL